MRRLACDFVWNGVNESLKNFDAVLGGVEGVDCAFGVGHHAENIAFFITNAGNTICRTVRVLSITEQDLVILFEEAEFVFCDTEISFTVGDGDVEGGSEGFGVEAVSGVLGEEFASLAAELEAVVLDEAAGEEVSLAEDLEAVADAQDEASILGKFD